MTHVEDFFASKKCSQKKFDISPDSSFQEVFAKMSAKIQQMRVEKHLDFNAFFEVLSMPGKKIK